MECQLRIKEIISSIYYQKPQQRKNLFDKDAELVDMLIRPFIRRPGYKWFIEEMNLLREQKTTDYWRVIGKEISLQGEYSKPMPSGFEYEKACFERMKEELLKEYKDQYVVIYQGKVADHDSDQIKLLKRVYKEYGYVELYCDLVTAEPPSYKITTPFIR